MARTAHRLTQALAGLPLVRGELRWPSLGDVDLAGATSLGTTSYGKHLFTHLDDGRTLHTHLRMEGLWWVERTRQGPAGGSGRGTGRGTGSWGGSDVRAVLATAEWTCWGRSLGMMDLVRTRDAARLVAHLGPDLMAADAEDNLELPTAKMSRETRPIAEVLLDQTVAAGIGTIWTAETLFRHRISPWRPAGQVDGAAVLTTASRLMRAAAQARAAPGTPGSVPVGIYGRREKPCRRCGGPVLWSVIGQAPHERRIYHCPVCQAS